jgi:hypothetical protein
VSFREPTGSHPLSSLDVVGDGKSRLAVTGTQHDGSGWTVLAVVADSLRLPDMECAEGMLDARTRQAYGM